MDFVLGLFSLVAVAADSYVLAGSNGKVKINEHGYCRFVTNSGVKAVFVPTKTAMEWARFRSATIPNVTTDLCLDSYESFEAFSPGDLASGGGWYTPTIGFGNCSSALRISDTWASHGSNTLWLNTSDDGFGTPCSTYAEKTFDLTNIYELRLDVYIPPGGGKGSTASVDVTIGGSTVSLSSTGTIVMNTNLFTGNQTVRITITQIGVHAYADNLRMYLK